MALELFKPFVMKRLVETGRHAGQPSKRPGKLVERANARRFGTLWKIVITGPSGLCLNRAPTLHRLGIQAFEPVLVEGKRHQAASAGLYRF